MEGYDYGVFADENRHTAIRVSVEKGTVYYIPMLAGELKIEKLSERVFAHEFSPVKDYPLRRAAEKFLHRPELTFVQPQAREHLLRIVNDPTTVYVPLDVTPQPTPKGEETMARIPKKTPVAPAADKPTAAAAGKKIPQKAKPAPAKKAAAPAAEAKPAAKGKAAAPTPARRSGEDRRAEPTAKADKPAAAPRAAADVNLTFNAENDGRVQRGFTRTFADKAKELGARGKKFTRDAVFAAFSDQPRAKLMDAYYACLERGVFVQAA